MKKVISILLAIVLSVTMLAACGNSGNGGNGSGSGSGSGSASGAESAVDEAAVIESLSTLGDAMALESSDIQTAVYDGKAIYAFKLGDTFYRARASISPEDEQAYMDIDYMDDDYEEQQKNILSPLVIDQIDNLSLQMLSREELDALVGKTGQDLQDAGWTCSGHNLDGMEFWMEYGPFVYTVVFDGNVPESEYEPFDDVEDTRTMTVKSVRFNGLGDATNIE